MTDAVKLQSFKGLRHPSGGDPPEHILYRALQFNNAQTVAEFLSDGWDPNKLVEGHVPLHLSVINGSLEIAQLLLLHGADIHAISANGCNALHVISNNIHGMQADATAWARLLLDSGINNE